MAFSQRKAVQTVLQSVVIATNNDHQPFHKARQVRSPTYRRLIAPRRL